MPVLRHDAFLREHPVFTGDELAAHLARIGSNCVRAQEKALEYCTRAGVGSAEVSYPWRIGPSFPKSTTLG